MKSRVFTSVVCEDKARSGGTLVTLHVGREGYMMEGSVQVVCVRASKVFAFTADYVGLGQEESQDGVLDLVPVVIRLTEGRDGREVVGLLVSQLSIL